MKSSALRGCETPRVFTRPLRELTPATTHGFAAIAFAEQVLGLRLFPWQKWLLLHALELRPDGLYRFRTVVVLVARQNGKTLIMLILALWHIYARGSRTVIGTAQDLTNAEKAWAEALEMAEGEPELAELIAKVVQQTGRKALTLTSGEQYRVAAASRRGARGFSGDLILLDELREHQSWDSWAAATKTTLARPKAQVWCFSNAGDALSIVLRYLRALTHQALDWPDGDGEKDVLGGGGPSDFEAWEDELDLDEDSLGLFEWSAPPGSPRHDRQAWAQANPSLNHTDIVEDVITERAIAAALRTDPPHVFEVEVLCRWIPLGDGGPFPPGKWAATLDNEARRADDAPRILAVDVSWNRSQCYVLRGGLAEDGVPVVDVAAQRAGTDWLVDYLVANRERYAAVVVQENGAPASSLIAPIQNATLDDGEPADLPLVLWGGAELGRATGAAYDIVDSGAVRHLSHPGLDAAASTARVRPIGDAWVIDRKNSPMDAAPLVGFVEVLWGLDQLPDDPGESVYESSDLMIV